MAFAPKAIKTPDHSLIRIDQMARVSLFDTGVGIFDERNRMIGWIECDRERHGARVSDLLLEVINMPRRAKQPDWTFLADGDDFQPPRETAPQPRRATAATTTDPNA